MSTGYILIADTFEAVCKMLRMFLEDKGYAVMTAKTGQQALDIVARQPIKLVLLDILLPDIAGREVLRILRQDHQKTELPIIMLMGDEKSNRIDTFLKMGANDYLTKPFVLSTLLNRIHNQLLISTANPMRRNLNVSRTD